MHGAQHLSRRRSARDAGMASDSVSDTDSEFDRLFTSGGSKPARPTAASPVAAPAAPVAPARSRSASPPSAFSDVGDAHARRLLERQTAELPRILAELEASGRKTSHWAWWAFPTELCGASEPGPATRVSAASAATVVARAPREWRSVLEVVVDLSETAGALVLPPVDHGRVAFFVAFWEAAAAAPPWLAALLPRYAALLPPNARRQLDRARAKAAAARPPPPRKTGGGIAALLSRGGGGRGGRADRSRSPP